MGPLACDAPSVKSMHFCLKYITYQNHGIDNANVWVPSIYHNYLRYQLWRAIKLFPKTDFHEIELFKEFFLPIQILRELNYFKNLKIFVKKINY